MPERMSRSLVDDGRTESSYEDRETSENQSSDLVAQPDRGSATQQPGSSDDVGTPLLGDTEDYRRRWEAVQTGFVDEPRRAVENADALVAEIIQELAKSFADERNGLESQWSEGDQVSTEELRVSLRRYRAFFDRLLTT